MPPRPYRPRLLRRRLAVLLSSGLLGLGLLAGSQAQVPTVIRPDNTLGTAVTQQGSRYTITGGTRPDHGPNLFHSFDRFSVGTGDTARFRSPAGIANILTRVTGEQASVIDGGLQSKRPGANLYLLNPGGVIFGPNARLDVSGSFHVSTADYLRLADGARFSARLSDTHTLSVAPPAAFGFLGRMPAMMTVQGSTLQVPDGHTLSVVGGEAQIVGGTLRASSGRIQIASVAAAGEVMSETSGQVLELQVDAVARLGRITLSQAARLDVSGNGGGIVFIRGGHLLVDGSFIVANNLGNAAPPGHGIDVRVRGDVTLTGGAAFTSRTGDFSTGQGGDMAVVADTITIAGGASLVSATGVSSTGRGGTVSVTGTQSVAVREGGGVISTVAGSGPGGSLSIRAPTGTIRMDGGVIGTFSAEASSGSVGEIRMEAGTLALTGSSNIGGLAFGTGKGGNITVSARESISIDVKSTIINTAAGEPGRISLSAPTVTIDGGLVGASSTRPGQRAGDIAVEAAHLTLAGGGTITANTATEQHGGNITVSGSESISISGFGQVGTEVLPSGISSSTLGQGNAGRISIATPLLTMDGGLLQANTSGDGHAGNIEVRVGRFMLTGGAQLDSSTAGMGRGGEVTVVATEASSITGRDAAGVRLSGLFSSTFSRGNAGRLFVSTPLLTMEAGRIQANTFGDGHAGNIALEVGSLTLAGGAEIASGTRGVGRGGEVIVAATETIFIKGTSGLFSNTFSRGDAGRLFISAPILSMDGGLIQAGAARESRGHAGALALQVGTLSLAGGARIDASTSGPGRGGRVTVTATESITITGRDSEGFESGLLSSTDGSGDGGSLFVSTPLLSIDEGSITTQTFAHSTGHAGNLTLEVGSLTFTGGAQISSSTSGAGRGGMLTVTARDSISIGGRGVRGFRSGLSSSTFSRGDAGRLFVSAPLLLMDGGSIVATTLGDGDAGDIEVRAGRVTLTRGAQIFSGIGTLEDDGVRGTAGSGRGGKVTVSATDSIVISGRDREGFRSSIGSNALIGRGNAGNTVIATPSLAMRDGFISTGALRESRGHAGDLRVEVGSLILTDGAQIMSSTEGPGQGGTVEVAATDVLFIAGRSLEGHRSGVFSDTRGSGQGGSIQFQGRHLNLHDAGTISASSPGAGAAGTIRLQVEETFRSHHGAVTTATARAGGGAIALRAGRLVQLRASEFTTSVQGGGGDAGNVTLDAPFVVVEGSQISANAFGGRGGNIHIGAEVFLADPPSQVTASSVLGITGTVDIQAQVTNLSGLVAPLPQDFARAAALLQDQCATRLREGTVSTFVARGRASLPAAYDGPLPSRLYTPQRPSDTPIPPQRPTGAVSPFAPLVLELSCTAASGRVIQ